MRAAIVAARAEAAARVFVTFMRVLAPDAPPEAQAPPPPPIDELAVAFETLGVSATATHAEVEARYRALAKSWHPDRFAGNPAKASETTVQMMQINGAYAAICTARGW